jgi:Ca-activated chloride channel homolog
MNAESEVLIPERANEFAPANVLTQVSATGRLNGLLFELTVEQHYRNPGSANIEAVYTFPLPSDAVLLDLDVRIGERTLTSVVVEKRKAEARFEDALAQGDSAAMLERATDGVYTVNLGNLHAGEEALIRYRYAQLLRFEHGSVRLTVPTVIAPRYGDPAAAGLLLHQAPVNDLLTEYPFRLTLTLAGAIAAGTIASPTHPIATTRTMQGVSVTLAKQAWLDRDFVLTVADVQSASLAVLAQDGDGCVTLASFCVDAQPAANDRPLALKLLVDCSGSMAGDSIAAARRALQRILTALSPADRFSLTRFGSHVVDVVPDLVPADRRAVVTAGAAIANMQADLGGTEMDGALGTVMAREGSADGADILLITDGEVWGLDRLIALARKARQRVFVVGIGAAPAEGILRKLAKISGGACEFVTPGEDAEGAIVRMFARLRSPRIARVDVQWPLAPLWTTPLPTGLFGGETVHVLAGFAAAPVGEAVLTLVATGEGGSTSTHIALPAEVGADATLARMAACRRIEVADRESQLDLALRYGLLTDRTNFIVVHERAENEKARDLPELRRVAQMHAAGWGGIGSVARAHLSMSGPIPAPIPPGRAAPPVAFCLDLDSLDFSPQTSPRPRATHPSQPMLAEPPQRDRVTSSFDALLTQLEQRVFLLRPNTLPTTIADLEVCGLDEASATWLREFVAEGSTESDVVRAFLEALAPLAEKANRSRHLRRTLRRQFGTAAELAQLRQRVAAKLVALA